MEFLKALFGNGEALTYDQLAAKVQDAKLNVVNISDGGYVARAKYDDNINGLKKQVLDLQGQISQRDSDMASLNTKLTEAQADSGKLTEAQKSLSSLQAQYEKDRQAWEAQTAKQAYEFAVKSAAAKYKFSSAAAQREFVRGALEAEFKMDGENIIGFTDYVEKYKTDDPAAFAEEKPVGNAPADPEQTPAPAIVLPSSGGSPDTAGFNFGFHGVRPKE